MPPEKKNALIQSFQSAMLGLIFTGVSSCVFFLVNLNRTIGVIQEKHIQYELQFNELRSADREQASFTAAVEKRVTILETRDDYRK